MCKHNVHTCAIVFVDIVLATLQHDCASFLFASVNLNSLLLPCLK